METPGISWRSFRHTFMQRCAWMPGDDWTKEKLEKETAKARLAIPSLMRRRQVKNFSSRISTEENNRSTVAEFYGSFSHIRATLDYTYHAHYTRKRQFLQDSIIAEFLDGAVITDRNGAVCTTPTEPWIVFTAGAMVCTALLLQERGERAVEEEELDSSGDGCGMGWLTFFRIYIPECVVSISHPTVCVLCCFRCSLSLFLYRAPERDTQ